MLERTSVARSWTPQGVDCNNKLYETAKNPNLPTFHNPPAAVKSFSCSYKCGEQGAFLYSSQVFQNKTLTHNIKLPVRSFIFLTFNFGELKNEVLFVVSYLGGLKVRAALTAKLMKLKNDLLCKVGRVEVTF